MLARPDLLDEADRASSEALALAPASAYVQGTRGAVLIERGEIAAGLRLLETAQGGTNGDPLERALNLGYIGLGELRRGNHEEARLRLGQARKLDPDCALLPRLAQELGP